MAKVCSGQVGAKTGFFRVGKKLYYGHLTRGYEVRGKAKVGSGVILSNNDGVVFERLGWLVTGNYDGGGLQRYYMAKVCSGQVGAKVGFFRVGKHLFHGDTNQGFVVRGKTPYGKGIMLSDNEGILYEKTGWLVTGKYDGGGLQRYMMAKVCGNYAGARLGYFKVSGKGYYGLSKYGYVFRNDYNYLSGHWYSANNDGVLTNIDGRFKKVESYVNWMIGVAADNSHGYDQIYRWGERGDYDCSSLTITALRHAGINTRWATYTGNMRSALTCSGFYVRGFDNLKRGDILLNDSYHVAVYIGDGKLAQASGNEWGGATGGRPGDQTGREIWVTNYYSYPWRCVLRFNC